jgi:uncharacterized membrane protein
MPLEQEVISLLISGFSIVMGVAFLVVLLVWIRDKRAAYAWVVLHFVIFSAAIYFFLQAISFDYIHPMASEEISLRIAMSGIAWALSMVFLIIGILSFSKKKKSNNNIF